MNFLRCSTRNAVHWYVRIPSSGAGKVTSKRERRICDNEVDGSWIDTL